MNKSIITYCAFLIILVGCSKTTKVHKKLAGEWTIASYKFTNSYGLSYYYPATGKFKFENCQEDTCDYDIHFNYSINDSTKSKDYQGWYYFLDKNAEYFDMINVDTSGTIDTLHDARIVVITKNDMLMLIDDWSGRHTFVLEK